MRNLLLTYNDMTFTVDVDEYTYEEVTKDINSMNLYAKAVYEATIGSNSKETTEANQETVLGNVNSENISSLGSQEVVSEPRHLSRLLETQSTSSNNNEQFRWTDKIIRCLLETRLRKESEFNNPVCKKIKLWKQIASEITTITGICVSGEICDTKYRNLLCTYRTNKNKQSTTGEGAIKWEYFHLFDEVLGYKASSVAPTENIGDSLDGTESETSSTSSQLASESISQGSNTNNEKSKKCRKRKCVMSFQSYLWEKNNREEQKEIEN